MAKDGRPFMPAHPAPALDDPAWFSGVMGSAATAIVASLHPGQIGVLTGFANATSTILLIGSVIAFVFLVVRDFLIRGLGRNLAGKLRSPSTGPAYATIPGAINVLAVAVIRVWPATLSSSAGWWLVVTMAGVGTVLGVCLTVVFFVAAFEHEQFQAEDISGIWFIPETVVLLGSFLFAELAPTGPAVAERGLAVLAVALLGAGALLFGVTAVIFVNRLVLHAGVHRTGAPAMWIMISPLAVTSVALQSVAGGDPMLGGSWTPAVAEVATFGAGALWGFALWWIAAATVVTRHAGRAALTRTAADWGFVFPSAAMVIATLALGRRWQSGLVETIGLALGVLLALVWVAVLTGTVLGLRRAPGTKAPGG
jgi:tellurite resistance protein TehA-like permease